MKKFYVLLCVMLITMVFTSCNQQNSNNTVSEALSIDVSSGKEIYFSDNHGGFHGDGTTYTVLEFSDDIVLKEIQKSTEWNEFPMNETVQTLVYGVSDETSQNGPYLTDNEGNTLIPKIENGYYRLIDRHTQQNKEILNRASFNFTLGIYDTEKIFYIIVNLIHKGA